PGLPVRVPEISPAEDVRHRLHPPAVRQLVVLAPEDVGRRPGRAVPGPDVLAPEDVRLRGGALSARPLGVEAAEDVGPRRRASARALAVLPAEDVGPARDLSRRGHGDDEQPEQAGEGEGPHVSSYNRDAARRSWTTRSRSAAGRSTFTWGPKPSTQFASSSMPRARIVSSVVPSFRVWNRSPRFSRRARTSAAVAGSISRSS